MCYKNRYDFSNTQEDFLGSENETEDGNPSSLWFKYLKLFQFDCPQIYKIYRFLKQKEKIHLWIYYFRLSFAFLQDDGLFSQIRNFTILQIPRSHLRKNKCRERFSEVSAFRRLKCTRNVS